MPYFSSNSSIDFCTASLVTGNCMSWSFFQARAFSNSSKIHFAVYFPNPNCRMQLLKELPVASCHKAIPTCSSTVTGVCIRVCCFWRSGLTRLHTYSNIGWATWKCSFHSKSSAWFPKRASNKFCGCGHAQALFQWCRFSTKHCWCNKYIINFHSELSLGYPWRFFSGAVVICGFQIQPCWWHFERLNCQVLDRE